MFRTQYIRTLFVAAATAAAALAAGCTDDPVYPDDTAGTQQQTDENAEPASLSINISIADLGIDVSTRAGEGLGENIGTGTGAGQTSTISIQPGAALPENVVKYLDPDSPVKSRFDLPKDATEQEKNDYREARSINGSYMTCLTVVLVHKKNNRIVAVRRIPDADCPDREENFNENDDAQVEEAMKNSILIQDQNGKWGLGIINRDDQNHVQSIHGTKACVTFDYEDPIHLVDEKLVNDYAKKNAGKDGKTEAQLIDENTKYIGKSAERLLRGEYRLFVIANYDHSVTTAPVSTTSDKTINVDNVLEDIANRFHQPQNMAEGIYPFNPYYEPFWNLRFVMNSTLKWTGTEFDQYTNQTINTYDVVPVADNLEDMPYIRPAVHQTLTATQNVYLEAGENHLDIELTRISSRTRVEVKNYGNVPLKVNSLEFSPNYTQCENFLFRREYTDGNYKELKEYFDGTPAIGDTPAKRGDYLVMVPDGASKPPFTRGPKVSYTGIHSTTTVTDGTTSTTSEYETHGAIVPFVNNYDFDGDGTFDAVGVAANEKRCIFDALMYESHLDYNKNTTPGCDPDSFTYTIDVSYPSVNNYKTPDINKIDRELWEKAGKPMEPDPDRVTFGYATANENKDYIRNPADAKSLYESIKKIEDDLKSVNGKCCFLIQGAHSNKYIYEKVDGETTTENGIFAYQGGDITLDKNGIDLKQFLWQLDDLKQEANGTYTCYIRNLRSGRCLPVLPQCVTPTADNHMMSIVATNSKRYILGVNNYVVNSETGQMSEMNVTFGNYFDQKYSHMQNGVTSYYNYAYLSVWGSEQIYMAGWHTADQGCQYRLYPVKMIPQMLYVGSPRMKKTVELTTFSDATGYVEKVREIQRNDFVRILVEVSYNSEPGDFDFMVKSWIPNKGGEVEFH